MIKFFNKILSVCAIFFFTSTDAQINSGFDNRWRDEFVVKNWNIETGLPQNTIKSLLQTRDGYLWFGTFGGLVRFDGIKFQLYNSGTNSELNNDRVLNLLENGNHLLVGFERGGIYKFEKGVFSRIDELRFLDRESVIGLVRDKLNNIWIHTVEKGIHRFHNNSIESFFKDEVTKNNTISILDRKGNLFFYHDDVCYYYNGTDFQPSLYKFKLKTEPLVHPFFDRDNKLFIVTPNSDFQIFDSTGHFEYLPNSKRFSLTVKKINQDSQLRYWLMTNNGLVLYKDNVYQFYSKNDGIKDNEILTFYEDKEKNFWLGSKTKGIFKLKLNPIKTILKENENLINNYTSVIQTKSGKILAGVNCGGVVMTDLNTPPLQLGFSIEGDTKCTWSLLEDSKGNLWIGTWGGGVFRLPNWENNHNNSALLKNFLYKINAKVVLAIAEDKNGNLWFGSLNNGVFKLDITGNVKRFSTDDGLPSNEIRCFLPFDDGSMWIGTGSGISKIVDDKVQDFHQIKDLPTKQIRSLYFDDDQTLWIGTNGEGLIRFKNNKAFRINATNGLYDNLVSQIVEDKQKRLWMGSNKGISFINKSEVKSLAEGKQFIQNFPSGLIDLM
ncbi:MAG TPA: two-component regulator propeller domain-containing protein [Ignavibacteriaceae bacterium]|nr:two-component regulator propeller domain-containing protein [Ignavibacteriaceae bacterium]